MVWAVNQVTMYAEMLEDAYCSDSLALVATQGVSAMAYAYSPLLATHYRTSEAVHDG